MFHFTIRFWDEDENSIKTENGLLAAEDYGKAVEKILFYYGKDVIHAFSIEEYDSVIAGEDLEKIINVLDTKVKV